MAFKTSVAPGSVDMRDLTFRPADPSSAAALRARDVGAFNRDGFVTGIPVFTNEEITDLREYVADLIDKVVSAPDRRNSYSISSYHVVCERLYDLIQTPRLLDLVQDLADPRHRVLGHAPLREDARRRHGGAAAPGRALTRS